MTNKLPFFAGVALVTIGVLLQVPHVVMMIRLTRDRDAMPPNESGMAPGMGSGMEPEMGMWSPTMVLGMGLLVAGMVLASFALFRSAREGAVPGRAITLDAIEHGRLRPVYWLTCLVLIIALVEDIMKPLTIGFVMPGMSREYGMPLTEVAVLPIVALTGTAVGSIIWGLLGDRYGRRTALLLATLLFIGTAACGGMPSFEWNLVMCFLMGNSAGGLLPLVFTLVAELTPRRHRSWVAVALGGIGGLGGYLAASAAAQLLEPTYTWRALWLLGLPSGLALLAMAPLIPESPLYLMRAGQHAKAQAVLDRYGLQINLDAVPTAPTHRRPGIGELFRTYPRLTTVIGLVGVVWGMTNFGFLVMLPAQLRASGMQGGVATALLTKSALYSAPALALVVLMYLLWKGRTSLAVFVGLVAVALGGAALWSSGRGGSTLLVVSIALLVLALSAVNAMLLPFSAETYPTPLRATGSGFAGAATKAGGVLGPFAMLFVLRFGGEGLVAPALALAVASLAAAGLMLVLGRPHVDRTAGPEPVAVPMLVTRD
ncbi:MFS transporter [Allorhizocola rhizosphaerae]|uniref:MFS transporter n=1 Tax=Allorhizocola rhizosphaerae TaxID=1872709 RepID=UPI000E3E3ED4|nr:MFS transporter [Allorhizocola rhizosphaerae]